MKVSELFYLGLNAVGFVLVATCKKSPSPRIFCCSASKTTPYSLSSSETSQSKQQKQGQKEEGLCPVKGSQDQMACGDGPLSHCVAVTISQTEELQAAGHCIFHGLNKQPVEAVGAGGDVTCADVFSSQLQEVVLDLGVSDAPVGRAVAACGNGTPAHHCGSLWAVPPSTTGVAPTSQWLVLSGAVPRAPCTLPGGAQDCCPNISIPSAWPSGRDTQ